MTASMSRWTALVSMALLIGGTIVTITQGSNPVLPATFVPNGPAGFHALAKDGSVVANGPRAGAINAFVLHPTNPDVIWIGAVNGGVWKTTNATTLNPGGPTWTPLTDHQPSLSIESLALDPTSPAPDVLVAGIGHASSFSGKGGPLTGILRTTDGGDTWAQLAADQFSSQSISAIAVRGSVIVAGTQKGIWRSHDTGGHFDHLDTAAGLIIGPVTDLEEDPSDSHRLYVGITGPGGGVFRSDTDGEHWTPVSGGDFRGAASSDLVTDARKLVIAVHANTNAGTHVLYAALIGADKNPSGVFRSINQGASWTQLDIPSIEFAAQGRLSMVADPIFANLVYLGGDETPGGKGEGPVYRCDANLAAGSQCTRIVGDGGATLSDTAPHPDSRRMRFDHDGNLIEVDDGGIFKRTLPGFPLSPFGDWTSLDGNLAITEPHSCAYDHIAQVTLCGTQDNGTVQQPTPGALVWNTIARFDGGIVAVTDKSEPSSRYYSSQRLGGFSRAQCDAANVCSVSQPALHIAGTALTLNDTNDPGVAAYTPIAAHATNPDRLVIATGTVYESTDGGENLTRLSDFSGTATRAIAYGSAGHPDILYVGSSNGLFLRTSIAGPMVRLDAYTFDEPVDIALDPDDWQSAWVVTSSSVLRTPDAGLTWSDVTFDLGPGGAGAEDFNTVAFIPRPSAPIIAVGASDGLYVTDTSQIGHWYKLAGALPNAVVQDLEYDATDDILLVTTLGRSTWTIAHAKSSIHLPAPTTLTYTGDTSVDYHDVAHLGATLTDISQGQPVAGKTVDFTIGSQSCSGVTGAAGAAACDLVITQVPGSYSAKASFGGDVSFAPSTTSAAFAITKEQTTLHYTGDTLIANGFTAHMAALLREDDVTPIDGATVTFTLGSGTSAQSCQASTDAAGTARCDISPVGQPLGPGTVTATFSGNMRYLPSSGQASSLIFAFLSSGSFVVGDGSAAPGGAVTFWGAQWGKQNPMTGGSAPSSFKGFAESLSASPPACGGTWSSSPGNSANAPATVPSYMGVIGSSHVVKKGSLVSGDVPAIVVVKTDQGYAPNPGHGGTGKVLAVFCHP